MTNLSVITIVRNRPQHLTRLIQGLANSSVSPHDLVVVDMSDRPIMLPKLPFFAQRIDFKTDRLALAAARNAGASAAQGQHLMFLDVDCIPRCDLIAKMGCELVENDALICPEVRYLGPDSDGLSGDAELNHAAVTHPVRSFPMRGTRLELNAGLFWSLTFGIRKSRFESLNGFDERYEGYGAEDTDFGFRAKESGTALLFLGGTGSFHQHHGVISPPLQHIGDIVRNATRFHRRWGVWPMVGWLQQFETMGLVAFRNDELRLIRYPTPAEIKAAVQPPTVFF